MDLRKFSAFKYRHDGQGCVSAKRRSAVWITLGLSVLTSFFFFPFGCFALPLPLIIYLTKPKMLYIGPRYLICGGTIIYFGNVNAMALDESSGTLSLAPANAHRFKLERDKFPTSARKAFKVKANQAAKFNKVSAKLIQKVLKASPLVEMSGIPDSVRQS